ncbi:hypothetical protein RRG08_050193 [Elysia crispata]|uniref:Uncharacterized protein n=1 Tax=Elysia crispata TaxID=231223 RepID=A0AAE1DAS7_9GAST|nr:hypothetical protein RRG08_050193 [Elysia crispata]
MEVWGGRTGGSSCDRQPGIDYSQPKIFLDRMAEQNVKEINFHCYIEFVHKMLMKRWDQLTLWQFLSSGQLIPDLP